MKQPFLPKTPFARLLAIISVASLFIGGTLFSTHANTVSAQLLQSDIEACRQHVNGEYRQLGPTIQTAYTTAFLAEKQEALAEIQDAMPSYIERMRAGELKDKIVSEVKEAYITRLKAVLPPFKEAFLQKKEELTQAWHDCAIDTTINFHLDDLSFDDFGFDEPLVDPPTECPIPVCAAPAEGCTYVADPTLNSDGCPANPCGNVVCEDEVGEDTTTGSNDTNTDTSTDSEDEVGEDTSNPDNPISTTNPTVIESASYSKQKVDTVATKSPHEVYSYVKSGVPEIVAMDNGSVLAVWSESTMGTFSVPQVITLKAKVKDASNVWSQAFVLGEYSRPSDFEPNSIVRIRCWEQPNSSQNVGCLDYKIIKHSSGNLAVTWLEPPNLDTDTITEMQILGNNHDSQPVEVEYALAKNEQQLVYSTLENGFSTKQVVDTMVNSKNLWTVNSTEIVWEKDQNVYSSTLNSTGFSSPVVYDSDIPTSAALQSQLRSAVPNQLVYDGNRVLFTTDVNSTVNTTDFQSNLTDVFFKKINNIVYGLSFEGYIFEFATTESTNDILNGKVIGKVERERIIGPSECDFAVSLTSQAVVVCANNLNNPGNPIYNQLAAKTDLVTSYTVEPVVIQRRVQFLTNGVEINSGIVGFQKFVPRRDAGNDYLQEHANIELDTIKTVLTLKINDQQKIVEFSKLGTIGSTLDVIFDQTRDSLTRSDIYLPCNSVPVNCDITIQNVEYFAEKIIVPDADISVARILPEQVSISDNNYLIINDAYFENNATPEQKKRFILTASSRSTAAIRPTLIEIPMVKASNNQYFSRSPLRNELFSRGDELIVTRKIYSAPEFLHPNLTYSTTITSISQLPRETLTFNFPGFRVRNTHYSDLQSNEKVMVDFYNNQYINSGDRMIAPVTIAIENTTRGLTGIVSADVVSGKNRLGLLYNIYIKNITTGDIRNSVLGTLPSAAQMPEFFGPYYITDKEQIRVISAGPSVTNAYMNRQFGHASFVHNGVTLPSVYLDPENYSEEFIQLTEDEEVNLQWTTRSTAFGNITYTFTKDDMIHLTYDQFIHDTPLWNQTTLINEREEVEENFKDFYAQFDCHRACHNPEYNKEGFEQTIIENPDGTYTVKQKGLIAFYSNIPNGYLAVSGETYLPGGVPAFNLHNYITILRNDIPVDVVHVSRYDEQDYTRGDIFEITFTVDSIPEHFEPFDQFKAVFTLGSFTTYDDFEITYADPEGEY